MTSKIEALIDEIEVVCIEGWEDDVVGEMAAKHLVKVVVQFQAKTGTQGSFSINAVGSNLDEY